MTAASPAPAAIVPAAPALPICPTLGFRVWGCSSHGKGMSKENKKATIAFLLLVSTCIRSSPEP